MSYPTESAPYLMSDKVKDDADHLRKMFIGGLSIITSEESLRIFYSQWGEVVDVIVMRDPATKRSRGFGFITYSCPSMVDAAQAARPHIIDGKTVDSKRALPRPETGKSDVNSSVKKIFVGGLKENHDEQALYEHFAQFGNVVNVKILTDKATGRKRGFAFVEFDDYDAVDKAVLHKSHTIKYVLVDVKKSVYKQELAKKLANHQQSSQSGSVTLSAQPSMAYHPQGTYVYSPQMTTAQHFNGWGGYFPSAVNGYQPSPHFPSNYGAYTVATPQNGTATAAWNPTGYAAHQTPGAWISNSYDTTQTQSVGGTATVNSVVPQTAIAGTPTATNGWNITQSAPKFGDYLQTYNGGPQKAGNLQGNRMNPYSVTAASNYGI